MANLPNAVSSQNDDESALWEDWMAAQEARGNLAFAPEELECHECSGFTGTGPMRNVTALGPITGGLDPYQTYILSCGHRVI